MAAMNPTSPLVLAAAALVFVVGPAGGAPEDDWIATWTASPQEVWGPDFPANVKVPRYLWDQTVRQVARVSIGGRRVRVVLSNEYGRWPVRVGAAQIAQSAKGAAIVADDSGPWRNPRLAGRIRELDGIRGVAILLVLVWHFFVYAIQTEPGSWQAYALVPLRLTWSGIPSSGSEPWPTRCTSSTRARTRSSTLRCWERSLALRAGRPCR
jgi:hypothetical protein